MSSQAAAKNDAYLRLNAIHKTFGTTVALKDMSLEIHLGEILGLVGPNGAGKTTLMKVITGAHTPTSGEVAFQDPVRQGTGYNANVAKECGVACAYQELSLFSNLTVCENFMVNLMDHRPFGRPGWRKRSVTTTRKFLDDVFPDHGIDVKAPVERPAPAAAADDRDRQGDFPRRAAGPDPGRAHIVPDR